MNCKMVVTDLDGTLLKPNKTISAYTKNTIDALKRKGILFVPATARPVRSVKAVLPLLEYDAAVYHNGAVVCIGETVIGHIGIEHPQEIVCSILKNDPRHRISIESNDRLYANFCADEIWHGVSYIRTQDFHELNDAVADKILIEAHSVDEMKCFEKYIPDYLYLQLSENTVAMMMNKQATKTNGIKLLTEHFGISMNEVIAFGDDYNDMDMLTACGYGVAVQNALEEVKAAADAVCAGNENDGVAKWLNDYGI